MASQWASMGQLKNTNCIVNFSAAVIRHDDHSNLEKKEFVWVCDFGGLSPSWKGSGRHGSRSNKLRLTSYTDWKHKVDRSELEVFLNSWLVLKLSKPASKDILIPRSYLNKHKQCQQVRTSYPNAWDYGGHLSFKSHHSCSNSSRKLKRRG